MYRVDYSATKRNEILMCTTGVNLESLMLSERSQIKKAIFKKRPAFSYTVNAGFLLGIYNILPKRLQAWAIRFILR